MRARLSVERTPCPNCGLETRTSSDGMCVECWGDKRRRGRAPFSLRKERGGDPGDEWLGSAAWWALGLLTSGLIAALLYGIAG
jgi:hypothetical protein